MTYSGKYCFKMTNFSYEEDEVVGTTTVNRKNLTLVEALEDLATCAKANPNCYPDGDGCWGNGIFGITDCNEQWSAYIEHMEDCEDDPD